MTKDCRELDFVVLGNCLIPSIQGMVRPADTAGLTCTRISSSLISGFGKSVTYSIHPGFGAVLMIAAIVSLIVLSPLIFPGADRVGRARSIYLNCCNSMAVYLRTGYWQDQPPSRMAVCPVV